MNTWNTFKSWCSRHCKKKKVLPYLLNEPAAESVDQAVLDNDSLLCMEEDEPEAWSISVEKKVVKKLSSKEVKRQDHIYAAAESVDQAVLDNDPLLCMEEDEPEAWSISVEKKVVKKLSSKEVKRQDHIYEIIQTEKNYCRILKIMQKILYEGLLRDVGVSKEVLNCLFPCLDELLHFHLAFLSNLQQLQSQNKDKIVDEIGKTLIEQFDGDSSERIKKAYGHFCSHYKEAVNQYKDLKTERKFLSFVKRCASNSIFKKREIPDFLLIVTQRLTKYPTLIETIHKNTKDKKERDKLNLALQLAKDILTNVNSQVEEYECQQRLDDIIHRTDTRSSALYRGRKFKKSDMCSNHRKLIHDGVIGLKTASGEVIDVMAVVLTDLIVLMQENNQKYTFAMRDNKSCVIPLCELLVLVREKGDTKDGKGIYLITRRVTEPEMYELVCKSTKDMWSWINHLLSAVDHCPQDAPVEATQSFEKIEEQKMMEIRTRKMKQIFESMTSRDNEIVRLCDEKKSLLLEYTELMSLDDAAPTIVSSTPTLSTLSSSATKATAMEKSPLKEEGLETRDLVQSALEEITRLTKVLQETGASLTPPQGGGTEHLGSSYSTHAVPKRAETFAGFDSKLRKDPSQKRPHSYVNHDGRSSSMFNIYESEGSHKEALKINNRKSTGYLQNMIAKNPALDPDGKQSVNLAGMALLQCVEMIPNPTSPTAPSNTETTAASVVSTPHPPTSCIVDQINNTAHISNFLHNFVQLSVQQSTSIEGMRLQLLEAREKITKLTAEKSEINKHSQLEGLRNLKNDLKLQKEDLQRQWIALQKQYDLLIEHRSDGCARRSLSERSQNPDLPGSDSDNYHNTIQHKRSASAELSSQTPDDVTSSSVQCHH